MKIAKGAAQGLEYLHDTANSPIVYSDFKATNILLDDEFNAKLSDFGLSKLGQAREKDHVSMALMDTYGYCAPEYTQTGEPTSKSDVYSFGVVLLEILSGRKAIDTTKPTEEQNLVNWVGLIYITSEPLKCCFVLASDDNFSNARILWITLCQLTLLLYGFAGTSNI